MRARCATVKEKKKDSGCSSSADMTVSGDNGICASCAT